MSTKLSRDLYIGMCTNLHLQMDRKNKAVEEVEKLLQDIGAKIDELIEKGKEVSGEAKRDIDQHIAELKGKRENLERDFYSKKRDLDEKIRQKKKEMDPKFKRSGAHFREAFRQLNEAIKALFD